jgi:hypothetical protein
MTPMRHLINLCETLDESVEDVGDPSVGTSYRVFIDPTSNALVNLVKKSRDKILKGLYEPSTGKVYVWDAYQAGHATAEYDLGLPYVKGKDAVGLVIGINDDGEMALRVCDDRAESTVKAHASFRNINFSEPDSELIRRWR